MTKNRTLFNRLLDIPFIGVIISIVNNYVGGGAFSGDEKISPFRLWLKFILLNLTAPALFTLIVVNQCKFITNKQACDPTKIFSPGEITLSVLPSVLGFGIGVYALIFVLSPKFVQFYHQEAQKTKNQGEGMTVLAVNADMAFPLAIITITLLLAVLQRALPDIEALKTANWYFLFWSLLETLALIGVIYRLGEQALLEKLPD